MDERADTLSPETYATRKSVLEAETVWRLSPDSLVRERQGPPPTGAIQTAFRVGWRILFPFAGPLDRDNWPDRVRYDQIESIRFRFDPTRFDRTRERCDLKGPDGARVTLVSTRYVSFGNFVDQGAAYRLFVTELMRRVVAARPQTSVYSGLSWPSYIFQHAILLAAFLALATILGIAGLPGFGTVWIKLLIIVSYLGTMWAYTRRNLPRKIYPPPS